MLQPAWFTMSKDISSVGHHTTFHHSWKRRLNLIISFQCMFRESVFNERLQDIRHKVALPQRKYAALARRPYASFSTIYASFYIQKIMVLYKEILKCDIH